MWCRIKPQSVLDLWQSLSRATGSMFHSLVCGVWFVFLFVLNDVFSLDALVRIVVLCLTVEATDL